MRVGFPLNVRTPFTVEPHGWPTDRGSTNGKVVVVVVVLVVDVVVDVVVVSGTEAGRVEVTFAESVEDESPEEHDAVIATVAANASRIADRRGTFTMTRPRNSPTRADS